MVLVPTGMPREVTVIQIDLGVQREQHSEDLGKVVANG